jgi:RNA polymerase sigma-70 factor (ECF subfamily)
MLLLDLRSPDRRREAARVLFERYVEDVRVVCRANMRDDPAAVDDMVNETFLRLLAHADRIRDGHRVGHWLLAVAKNVCADSKRRRYRTAEVPIEYAHRIDDGTVLAETVIERQLLRQGLARLNPNDRALLSLHYLDDCSYSDIAERTGSTYQSIKARTHTARRRLREWAEERAQVLIPVPLLNWLRNIEQQLHGQTPLAWQAVGTVVVAAVIGLSPVIGGDSPAIAAGEGPHARQAATAIEKPRAVPVAQVRRHTPAVVLPQVRKPATLPTRSSARESKQHSQHDEVVVPLGNTGHGIRTGGPSGPPDYRYSTDAVPGEPTGVEFYNKDAHPTVNEPACEAVATAPAVVTCTSSR